MTTLISSRIIHPNEVSYCPPGFVGPQHLHALVRLLGYQGVAVVVAELLGVARGLLHGTLAQFTRALQHAMPRHCKLPRYDYGSNGRCTNYTYIIVYKK